MASFVLQAFRAGVAPLSIDFADEQAAYAETMRLQKGGAVVKLMRTKDQKILFDTTNGAEPGLPPLRPKRSKLAPALAFVAIAAGIMIAFGMAFFKGH